MTEPTYVVLIKGCNWGDYPSSNDFDETYTIFKKLKKRREAGLHLGIIVSEEILRLKAEEKYLKFIKSDFVDPLKIKLGNLYLSIFNGFMPPLGFRHEVKSYKLLEDALTNLRELAVEYGEDRSFGELIARNLVLK
ncbi:hypothetical protein COV11_04670 [Candidatus Woesearchaeota archaeon CG10_big_fil_rev_8_21_14_0_10_30_7]|nr:MAG: hypothetical protein COV11_04670 [Candidatus Woesearchaeota archaeon CG10_big_fil_rev_8_21_14_0_10_30_7]